MERTLPLNISLIYLLFIFLSLLIAVVLVGISRPRTMCTCVVLPKVAEVSSEGEKWLLYNLYRTDTPMPVKFQKLRENDRMLSSGR